MQENDTKERHKLDRRLEFASCNPDPLINLRPILSNSYAQQHSGVLQILSISMSPNHLPRFAKLESIYSPFPVNR
jgi:hypothetical protein